jgi:hypothetical protein
MNSAQQIIGVNDRLGNAAVANMQGTTRAIYDIVTATGTQSTFFSNVQTRPYPFSNISQNRFEVGESLAIESIALIIFEEEFPLTGAQIYPLTFLGNQNPILNLYIGNQRVIKDLALDYAQNGLANFAQDSFSADTLSAVFRLETPIVIPPQIEFYATLQVSGAENIQVGLILQGTGTLLNPKSNF